MVKNRSSCWWPIPCPSETGVLGITFAISRGNRKIASATISPGLFIRVGGNQCDADIDAAALRALYNKRTADVLDFRRWLESLIKPNTENEFSVS
jgi:hypothetical protein